MDVARRLKFGLAALVALAASAFFAAPALADTQPDPQLTNIPYLAWRGEEVRLVKCEPDILAGLTADQQAIVRQNLQSTQFAAFFVDFLLVDWSGDPLVVRPQLEPGTVSMFFRSFDGAPCVAGTFVSQKAGLADVKLVVTFNLSQALGFPIDGVPEIITLKHDFNVAWMNIATSTLNVCQASFGSCVPGGPTTEPAGGSNNLEVLVTGSIPLLSDYSELGLGDHLTMPDDWPRLAQKIATFQDPLNPNPAALWDIHDEFSPTDSPDPDIHGSGTQTACEPNALAVIDTVDNCDPEVPPVPWVLLPVADPFEIGAFSRIWQDFTNPTVGPFDPQRPSETELSNGILDKGDAPMPSALINFIISPNSGAPTDISGVGYFTELDKHHVYSRNGAGSTPLTNPGHPEIFLHNLYGPFYATWLPATVPSVPLFGFGQPEASGIAGPINFTRETCGRGNNFPGFLANCFYHYWDFARVLRCGPGGTLIPVDGFASFCRDNLVPSGCLPLVAGGTPPKFGDAYIPGLDQHVDVYTDEHGEARVKFNAGTEFFFTHLPGVGINSNGGCDIANIPNGVLGSAAITAVAKYPFEPVTAQPVASNTIVKTITSRFQKSITCYPKGTQPEERNAAICVARALDITGAPFVGETVCFMADFNAEDVQWFTGTITTSGPPPIVIGNAGRNTAEEAKGLRRICPYTDSNGRAAVEIFNTNPTTVDVQALFVDEGILRHLLVQFPITGQQGPSTGAATTSTGSTPTGSTGTNGNNGSTGTTGTNPNVKYTIVKLKIVKRLSKTKARVKVRVNGPTGKAALRLQVAGKVRKAVKVHRAGKVHKVMRNKLRKVTMLRKVKTNKVVTVTVRTPKAKRLRLRGALVT